MGIDDTPAHLPSLTVVVGRDDAECSASLAGILGILLKLCMAYVEGGDNHLLILHTVDTPIIVPAVFGEVCQLHRATFGNTLIHQLAT